MAKFSLPEFRAVVLEKQAQSIDLKNSHFLKVAEMLPRVSLTFDNGPSPMITDLVLDTVGEFGVKATFFLVGKQLDTPEGRLLATRAASQGHRLGNHSFNHGPPLGLRTEVGEAAGEIRRMHDLLGDLAGRDPLYRPNGRGSTGPHLFNREAIETLVELGSTIVLWSSIPRDRKAVVGSPDAWVADAKQAVLTSEWPVIVLHDRPSGFSEPGPMAFLREFLAWAAGRVEFSLEFPDDVVPMRRGIPGAELARFVTG